MGCYIENCPAQNLFANPGFEDLNVCTEYNATCAPEAWYYIKPTTNPLVLARVAPKPLLGSNVLIVPIGNVNTPSGQRSFVYTMLACPLQKGRQYKLSFYLNSSKRKFYNIDFYFSEKEPSTHGYKTNGLVPSLRITPIHIEAEIKQAWQAIVYNFTATENARFCLIGNMTTDPLPFAEADKMSSSGNIYYFLDEIKLTPVDQPGQCETYKININKMYAQNYRHTDFTVIEKEEDRKPEPVFIKDTVTVPAAFFETGNATLKPSFQKILDTLLVDVQLKKLIRMDVIGHTDDRGTVSKNLTLSHSRAKVVEDYILQTLPKYHDIIFSYGKGQDSPVSDNITELGRSKNRRVEIVITYQQEIQ